MGYMDNAIRVEGKKKADIFLFALSTCGWCKKTKRLLNELGVEYKYVDVDLLTGSDKEEAKTDLLKCNPLQSFPTINVDNGRKSIVGFVEDEIREEFGDGRL